MKDSNAPQPSDGMNTTADREIAALSAMILGYVHNLCPDGATRDDLSRVLPTFDTTTLDAALQHLVQAHRLTPLRPTWNRAEHELAYGPYSWRFKSCAYNVVAILDAFHENSWHSLEFVKPWMPKRDQLRGRPAIAEKALDAAQIRDALTVLKDRTVDPGTNERILMWRRKGIGASWESRV